MSATNWTQNRTKPNQTLSSFAVIKLDPSIYYHYYYFFFLLCRTWKETRRLFVGSEACAVALTCLLGMRKAGHLFEGSPQSPTLTRRHPEVPPVILLDVQLGGNVRRSRGDSASPGDPSCMGRNAWMLVVLGWCGFPKSRIYWRESRENAVPGWASATKKPPSLHANALGSRT